MPSRKSYCIISLAILLDGLADILFNVRYYSAGVNGRIYFSNFSCNFPERHWDYFFLISAVHTCTIVERSVEN